MSASALRFVAILGVSGGLLAAAASPVHANGFTDGLVQAPALAQPERGSVVGSLARTSFGPAELLRGTFTLPAPLEAPQERGPLLARVFPSYSPEGGISEWGLGWQTDLAIVRTAIVGDLDYGGSEFSSPWGRLVLGDDGYYYPAGLQQPVRLAFDGASWESVAPDGTRSRFAEAVQTPAGTYAWYLSSVTSVLEDRTVLTYARNASGRPFLTSVIYGAKDRDDYRLRLQYEALAQPFTDYRSGTALVLDRRVSRVLAEVRHAQTQSYELRWRFELEHEAAPLGPAFFLRSITKVYRSGASEPPVVYTYDTAADGLQAASFTHVPGLDSYLAATGGGGLSPTRVAMTDFDEDGRVDLEHHYAQTRVSQTDTGWHFEALPPNPSADKRCRPSASNSNAPRRLVRLTPGAKDPHVLFVRYHPSVDRTELAVCDYHGNHLETLAADRKWALDANTRLVDINRDHRPDIVRLGTGAVQVLENLSDETGFAFAPRPLQQLTPSFQADMAWVQDINGDGLADLIGRYKSGLVVWYGRGNAEFTEVGEELELWSSGTQIVDLQSFGVYFGDINKDGLTDVVLTKSVRAWYFVNQGTRFEAVDIPALESVGWNASNPLVADLSGDGSVEITYTSGTKAYALALSRPGTGLMTSADDGKGNRLRFSYDRAPAWPGIGQRPTVLAELTSESSGYDALSHAYDYEEPTLHSRGRFLVGFGTTRRISPIVMEEVRFHNDDEVAGVVLESLQTDTRTPGLYQFSQTSYAEASLYQVRFLRPTEAVSGWRSLTDEGELAQAVSYEQYERGFCPTRVSTANRHGVLVREAILASPAALSEALHCQASFERLVGSHADASLDFVLEQGVERNGRGQILSMRHFGGEGPLLLQEVSYDSQHRLTAIARPGQGTTTIGYDAATGLLQQVVAPDGVVARADGRDPVSDELTELVGDRGEGGQLSSWFRFDARERLHKAWQSFGGSTEEQPLAEMAYQFPSPTAPGSVVVTALVDATGGTVQKSLTLVAGDGETVAEAQWIPAGWALTGLVRHDRNELSTTTYYRSPIAGSLDVSALDYSVLYAGATALGQTESAGFGHPIQSWAVIQEGVERSTTSGLALAEQSLVTELVENDTHATRAGADLDGNLLWVQDQAGYVTTYEYDALGRLVVVRLPDGQWQRVAFDSYGRIQGTERNEAGSVAYRYDPATALPVEKQVRGRNGALERSVTLYYDGVGRLLREQHELAASGEALEFHYEYDGASTGASGQRGHLTRVTGAGYEKTSRHNPDGTIAEATLVLADWMEVRTSYAYLAGGAPRSVHRVIRNLATDSVVDDVEQSFAYDAYGRLRDVLVNGTPLIHLVYDPEGKLERAELTGGQVIAYDYDQVTRALRGFWRDANTWNAGVQWTLDARGHVQRESFAFGDDYWDRDYTYDARGFLTASKDKDNESSYSYSPSGLPDHIDDEQGPRAVYRGSDQTLLIADTPYAYDDLGRLVQKGDLALHYGPNGHLATATRGTQSWHYLYDEAGQRLLKLQNGTPLAAYVDGGYLTADRFVAPLKVNGTLIGVLENGQFHLLATDPRGTLLADRDGTPRLATPFGVRTHRPDLSAALDYVEKAYDPDLGLIRMGVRDYDPYLGQFTTPDPLFLEAIEQCVKSPLECNLYGYARNNPLSFIDPFGTDAAKLDYSAPFEMFQFANGNVYMHYTSGGGERTFYVVQPQGPASRRDGALVTKGAFEQSFFNEARHNSGEWQRFHGRLQATEKLAFTLWASSAMTGAAWAAVPKLAFILTVGQAGNEGEALFAAATSWSGIRWPKPQLGRLIDPSDIRFSQRTVNGADELTTSMQANGWKGDPIDVVRMGDGGLTAIDNTRVLAAHRAGVKVRARVHGADDLLPPELVARFTTKQGAPSTWGEAIRMRIDKQGAAFRNRYP